MIHIALSEHSVCPKSCAKKYICFNYTGHNWGYSHCNSIMFEYGWWLILTNSDFGYWWNDNGNRWITKGLGLMMDYVTDIKWKLVVIEPHTNYGPYHSLISVYYPTIVHIKPCKPHFSIFLIYLIFLDTAQLKNNNELNKKNKSQSPNPAHCHPSSPLQQGAAKFVPA